jgi:hypothetical protein
MRHNILQGSRTVLDVEEDSRISASAPRKDIFVLGVYLHWLQSCSPYEVPVSYMDCSLLQNKREPLQGSIVTCMQIY